MRKGTTILLMMTLICSLPAMAGDKQSGTTTLKDFQPAGTTDKKHKHQQFDFTFEASGTQYTCRSSEGTKLKAIDWPVGGNITYQVNKDKGKVKNSKGKEVDCTMMRVQEVQPAAAPAASN